MSSQPTVCFITMCKNESHCIRTTLESIHHLIDYWVVCDTGSTDNTCEIVSEFFKEKNIPGELFIDEFKGFDKHKTLMFERAYNKTDLVLHLDADDFLVGNLTKDMFMGLSDDKYNFNYVRGPSKFITSSLYNNRLKWLYAGVAHNIIVCLDKPNHTTSNVFLKDDLYVDNNERGARKFDPNKYINDALKLKDQFFDTLYEDPYGLMYRSVFYTGQSYMDSKHYKEAIQWYTLYIHLKDTWSEERFEAHTRLAKCMMSLDFPEEKIKHHIEQAIALFPDRAEPNYILGKYYNGKSRCDLGYGYLRAAYEKNFQEVSNKYVLFVNKYMYGKHVYDELSVACYWTNRGQEGYDLLKQILDDPEFEWTRERLVQNKQHFLNKYPDLEL